MTKEEVLQLEKNFQELITYLSDNIADHTERII